MRDCLLLALLLVVACAVDPPAGLSAGQCREDVDCPGTQPCLHDGGAGSLGRCGCRRDLDCPSWSECSGDGAQCRAWTMACDAPTGECACAPGDRCPGALTCGDARRCECATDDDCPDGACTCQAGRCVRPSGDDTLSCELVPTPAPDEDADAGGSPP